MSGLGKNIKRWGGILLLLLSVICITAGVMRGEEATVLTKAVYICLECIGIG